MLLNQEILRVKFYTMKSDTKVVAALACRVQSTRLYGKPLQLLDIERNISIIDYLIAQLKSHQAINEVVLAISEGTENEIFKEVARKHGLKYVIGDQIDVLGRLIQAGEKSGADIIFRTTSENPFIYLDPLEDVLIQHKENNTDYSYIAKLPRGAFFELINLESLKRAHQKGQDRHRSELCVQYINENPKKFKIQKIFPQDKSLHRPDIRLTVDYPEDLIVAREAYSALKKKDGFVTVDEVISFLDTHPELNELNRWILTDKKRIWR